MMQIESGNLVLSFQKLMEKLENHDRDTNIPELKLMKRFHIAICLDFSMKKNEYQAYGS